ncbi:hypothetical protein BDF14DRAFT_1833998, partial [Spinellus fusiger]
MGVFYLPLFKLYFPVTHELFVSPSITIVGLIGSISYHNPALCLLLHENASMVRCTPECFLFVLSVRLIFSFSFISS